MKIFSFSQNSQERVPFHSLNGAIFMLVGVLLFSIALFLELLPLLLWSAFMMALIILLIISLAIIYPFLIQKIQLIELVLPTVSDTIESAVEAKIIIPSRLLYFFLFFYELEIMWDELPYKHHGHIYQLKNKAEQFIELPYPSRGIYALSAKLRVLDIFGFFALEFNLAFLQNMLIPASVNLPVKFFPNIEYLRNTGSLSHAAGQYDSNFERREFYDFKRYVIGDDVRSLDWRLFARFNELFIKNMHNPIRQDHAIHLELIVPKASAAGEHILDKIVNIAQYIAQELNVEQKDIVLRAGYTFRIDNFDGISLAQREKLAHINTKIDNRNIDQYAANSILIMDHNTYETFKVHVNYTQNYTMIVIQEQMEELFSLQKEGSIIYFV